MISIILLVLLVLLTCVHIFTRYNKKSLLIDQIPGPQRYPIIGNFDKLLNMTLDKLWYMVRDLLNQYYPIIRFWVFHIPVVGMQDPNDFEIILTSQKATKKAYPYKFLNDWLKSGLLTSDGEKYFQRRKLLTNAFHINIMNENVPVINKHGNRLIQSILSRGAESVLSVSELFLRCTLNVTVESGMGVDMDKLDEKTADDYRTALHDMGEIFAFRIINPYIQDWMLNSWTKFGNFYKKTVRTFHELSNTIIQKRREYNKCCEGGYNKINDNKDIKKKKYSVLDLLLLAEKNDLIDDEGIKEEINTILGGGTDTSQIVLAYTCLLLSEHKEIQDKIRAEVNPVLAISKGEVGVKELQKFSYLERCIKESLRLFPPIPMIGRTVTEDIQLKKYIIPAETTIALFVFEVHRDPNFWPDPEKFDPDRFLPEEISKRHRFAYLPFSAGTRSCIGQKFAMMTLKSVLSKILYNFYLEPVTRSKDIRFKQNMVLESSNPIYVKFIKKDLDE